MPEARVHLGPEQRQEDVVKSRLILCCPFIGGNLVSRHSDLAQKISPRLDLDRESVWFSSKQRCSQSVAINRLRRAPGRVIVPSHVTAMIHPDREFPSTNLEAVAKQKVGMGRHETVTQDSPYSNPKPMPVSQFLV